MAVCNAKNCQSWAVNVDPDQLYCDVCFHKTPLLNLLAIIHRDGGHYTEKHGVKKSAADASKIIAELVVKP